MADVRIDGAVRFIGSFTDTLPPPSLPEVAFAGRSNVGKSSAINVLIGSDVARVSRTPGRTQSINLFAVGERWMAVDLPGYGYAKVARGTRNAWKGFIEAYLGERATLRVVVILVDARIPPQDPDRVLIDGLRAVGIPSLILATKIDDVPRGKRAATIAALARAHVLPPEALLPFSAHERLGVEPARSAIAGWLR